MAHPKSTALWTTLLSGLDASATDKQRLELLSDLMTLMSGELLAIVHGDKGHFTNSPHKPRPRNALEWLAVCDGKTFKQLGDEFGVPPKQVADRIAPLRRLGFVETKRNWPVRRLDIDGRTRAYK